MTKRGVISTSGRNLSLRETVKRNKILNCSFDCAQDRIRNDSGADARNDIRNENPIAMKRTYYVYMLTNWNNEVMYVGITNNLERRVYEHRQKLVKGFTEKYNVSKLVYFEETNDVE